MKSLIRSKFWLILALFVTVTILPAVFRAVSASNSEFAEKPHQAPPECSQRNYFQENFPPERKIFGFSEKGRIIDGYEFGGGGECLLFIAAVHGNEKSGRFLLEKFAAELFADRWRVGQDKKIVIIPLANPDGYADREDKLNANGVNLNRNFRTKEWIQYEGEDTFAGPEPFSENESRIIRRIVEQYEPKIMISFHSKGALVSPEENPASHRLARWYSEKTGYEYFTEWEFTGTATRWFVEATGRAAITVELTDHIGDDWEINREALLELAS